MVSGLHRTGKLPDTIAAENFCNRNTSRFLIIEYELSTPTVIGLPLHIACLVVLLHYVLDMVA